VNNPKAVTPLRVTDATSRAGPCPKTTGLTRLEPHVHCSTRMRWIGLLRSGNSGAIGCPRHGSHPHCRSFHQTLRRVGPRTRAAPPIHRDRTWQTTIGQERTGSAMTGKRRGGSRSICASRRASNDCSPRADLPGGLWGGKPHCFVSRGSVERGAVERGACWRVTHNDVVLAAIRGSSRFAEPANYYGLCRWLKA
jgi:hypothetical protein